MGINVSIPLITEEEWETMNNSFEDFVNGFIKTYVKDKDLLIAQTITKRLDKQKKDLIKYLEDKLEELKAKQTNCVLNLDYDVAEYTSFEIKAYQDILERVKSGKYE